MKPFIFIIILTFIYQELPQQRTVNYYSVHPYNWDYPPLQFDSPNAHVRIIKFVDSINFTIREMKLSYETNDSFYRRPDYGRTGNGTYKINDRLIILQYQWQKGSLPWFKGIFIDTCYSNPDLGHIYYKRKGKIIDTLAQNAEWFHKLKR